MPNLLTFETDQFFIYFLILLRISGFLFTAPIISDNTVSPAIRIGFAILVTLLIFQIIPSQTIQYSRMHVGAYLLLCAQELTIGLILGYIPQIILAAIEFAGNLIGLQIGFSIANVIDPQSEIQVSILGSLKTSLAMLLFLILDAHHLVFELITESFRIFPLRFFLSLNDSVFDEVGRYSSQIFILALKLSAPLTVIIILTNIIMGFMARSVPQFNVFIVGFPISIGMGILFVGLSMPYFIEALSQVFNQMQEQSLKVLKLLSP